MLRVWLKNGNQYYRNYSGEKNISMMLSRLWVISYTVIIWQSSTIRPMDCLETLTGNNFLRTNLKLT